MTRLTRIVGAMPVSGRAAAAGLALCLGLGAVAGCTDDSSAGGHADRGVPTGSYRLLAFDSCEEALKGLRAAAKEVVGPYGFRGQGIAGDMAGMPPQPSAQERSAAGAGTDQKDAAAAPNSSTSNSSTPNFSGTNTAEAGVDEPDLVKTDGQRIVTVAGGKLRVVDAASKTITGSVSLTTLPSAGFSYQPADLLLAGDHALVLFNQGYLADIGFRGPDASFRADVAQAGPQLVLVDISGKPRVLSTARLDASLVDARQVGDTVRVVIRSYPRIPFDTNVPFRPQAELTATNKARIDSAPIDAWLPRVTVTTNGATRNMPVDCGAISRPTVYSGTSLLTVLTYDLGGNSLEDGRPTTIVADGETVYSNGTSLYVTNDQRWQQLTDVRPGAPSTTMRTEIYQFDTSTSERARFLAGGSVPGYLINQYAMSEWDGKLRIATTTGQSRGARSESGVYVLIRSGESLNLLGQVDGLGKGERIYAVRFVGPIGYVVTFRQTDPLYTVDLSDPARPEVKGALKISGYSSYLHPAGGTRVIGIGQDATDQGRVKGTQVSLFDVADLAAPGRLAQYTLPAARSEAEFDPHAFLYWPADGLLVVPLQNARNAVESGALVLRVSGDSITEVGFIDQRDTIRRSLIIDQTLWTVSNAGLQASDAHTLQRLAWIPFA